jgi:hypothetical protein
MLPGQASLLCSRPTFNSKQLPSMKQLMNSETFGLRKERMLMTMKLFLPRSERRYHDLL